MEATTRNSKRLRGISVPVRYCCRYHSVRTTTRSHTLPEPTNSTDQLWQTASELLTKVVATQREPVRLVGMGVSELHRGGELQRGLFDAEEPERQESVGAVGDQVRPGWHWQPALSGCQWEAEPDVASKNLTEPGSTLAAMDYLHENPVRRKLATRRGWHWQPALSGCQWEAESDVASRNLTEPGSTLAAIDYLHENPVRRKLATRAIEWRWSSARFYINHPDQRYNPPPTITPLPAEFFDRT